MWTSIFKGPGVAKRFGRFLAARASVAFDRTGRVQ